jgi:amino acid transporter
VEAVPEYPNAPPARLRRRIGLPLLVLYGTGATVGAGIYVLIGAVADHAQMYSSCGFALAAALMALTAASYAELATIPSVPERMVMSTPRRMHPDDR